MTGPRARDPQPGDPEYSEHLANRIRRCISISSVMTHGSTPRDLARDIVAMPEVRALLDQAARPAAEQPGDGIDPTIASGYRLEDIRDLSPRDLGFGADGHSDEQAGGERDA